MSFVPEPLTPTAQRYARAASFEPVFDLRPVRPTREPGETPILKVA
jgi:hypothetical protein